jgi:tRNA A37 threonylcarbamoyladenosine biosynthesis protein TsaE
MNEKQTHDDVYKMLSQSGYSDKAIQYFQAKKNIAVIENADQITDVTGP